jgi:hypothetical protein
MTPSQFDLISFTAEQLETEDYGCSSWAVFQDITHFLSLNQIKLENTNDE